MISMPAATVVVNPAVLGVNSKVLATGGAAGVAPVGRGQGLLCPRPSWLQQTHSKTQLSPSAKLVAPL